jgi:thiol-disulfide isomerase/thioredoxin
MKYLIVVFFLMVITSTQAQIIKTVNVNWVDSMHTVKNDTLYIINFWATWCKPCVEELPNFELLAKNYQNKKVKMYLVTTDMRKDIATRVTDFVKAKGLTQQVIFINEVNADKWINKVSTAWTGAIPATWFIKGNIGYEKFHEGELTYEELEQLVKLVIP